MNSCSFPTVDPKNPAALTEEEETVLNKLVQYFIMSERLQKHIRYLFIKGSMYLTYNGNLLIHAGIPMHMNGTFREVAIEGLKYSGKALLDKYDKMVREAYFGTGNGYKVSTDLLWFLWCHKYSPCFGKDKMATFERYFLNDKETHKETYMPFYHIIDNEAVTIEVLKEFGADPENGRLINGHVPVKELKGEQPMRAHGRRLVIDGGYAKPYQKSTGIAGYTLTYNSFGMVLISHKPFESVEKAVNKGLDIEGEKRVVDKAEKRMRVKDTDTGKKLSKQIYYLEMLISAYRKGSIIEGN
jgi:fructose-1,6-bisphosphatase-3